MNPLCARVMDRLEAARLPPELEQHVAGCARCQDARAGFRALPPPAAPRASANALSAAAVLARAELIARPQVRPWWREAVAAGAASLACAGLAALVLGRGGLVHNRAPVPALVTVGLSLLLLVAWSAYAGMAPRARLHRLGVLAFALEIALLVGLAGSGDEVGPLWATGMPCLITEVLVSLLPLGAVALLLTRSAFDPLRTGVAGLGASASGMLALHLHCADGSIPHLLLFHALPWLLLPVGLLVVRGRLPSQSDAP